MPNALGEAGYSSPCAESRCCCLDGFESVVRCNLRRHPESNGIENIRHFDDEGEY
jgi:hypothetical protein